MSCFKQVNRLSLEYLMLLILSFLYPISQSKQCYKKGSTIVLKVSLTPLIEQTSADDNVELVKSVTVIFRTKRQKCDENLRFI